jgi:hypothetical protein
LKIKEKTCQAKGQIALLKAETRAVEKGYIVSRPSEGNRYDLIIDDGNKLLRVQVKHLAKYFTGRKNTLHLTLTVEKNKHYVLEEIDYLMAYNPERELIFCFPSDIFHKKASLCIHLTNPKSKYYYKKFIW